MADTPGAIAGGASGDDAGRALTGILGLDDVLAGGLPRDRLYLVEGTPGTGKTTLALQFLLEGQRRGQRGMYVTLSETAGELRASEGAAPFFPLGPAISPAMSCGVGWAAASERGGTRMVDRGRREGQGLGGGDADPVRSLDRLAVHTSSASSAWTGCGCEVRPAPATSSSGRPLGAAETAAPDPLVQAGEPAAGSRVVEGRQEAVHGQQRQLRRPAPACAPRSSASTPWRSSPPASAVPPSLARPIA